MTSIIREFDIAADEKPAWDALADVAVVNKIITFLGPVTYEGDVRKIDMGEYGIIEELIVAIDHDEQRVAYSVQNSPWNLVHHHSTMQILPPTAGAAGARLRWVVDLKPDSAAEEFAAGMENAIASLKSTLRG